MSRLPERELVVGITPFEEPNAALAVALARAGAVSVLDLGRDAGWARAALADVCRWWPGSFGVRVPPECPLSPADLPEQVHLVVHGPGSRWPSAPGRRAFVEVVSVAQARTAVRAGAYGLIAKGSEAGGRVGTTTTFVLLQQLLADPQIRVPVWAMGGIGLHTAAAAVAGGAAGVVLDTQLALVAEAGLPAEVAAAIRVMDGSETAVVGDHRLYVRPDLPGLDPDTVAARLGARDLSALPIGQDGGLAAPLAQRYVTAGGVVVAVRDAVTDQVRAARAQASQGLRPLVVQGPMTRVSDQAGFAAAVAAAGGLPFLALSLSDGEQARGLLEQTAALLGGRPWGVGILGFVPPEIREAQLAAVHQVRPPYALIAGGRPAQALQLDAVGIETFLHVPSPGLLDRYLAEGVRRFVFEGQECGGHVGRQASFPLWETQLQRLLNDECASQLQVLFAGGIHDERSAAMVAAMAAPLVERGAQIGVLMGTAYLFTQEAIAAGAIAPGYQQAALACASTVLLETAPGHAIRCSDSPYVRTFTETKARLVAAGVPRDQLWTELEALNLGRLRIAAKGLRRSGDTLVAVDEEVQHQEGMVMLGEVATLRTATTTIEALHTQVTEGAAGFLAARADELGIGPHDGQSSETPPLDVAIIGMAGVFPGAGDLASYWANLLAGVDAVTEVPTDRWDPAVYNATPNWGGFIPDIPFDALAYGIPPAALASIDPVQLLALEVAARALRDAGYERRDFDREHTSVIFGAEGGTDLGSAYAFRSMYPAYHPTLPAELDEQLPTMTEDSFPGVLPNVVAGRIANRLDLGGTNYTVSAACASALAAINLACKELQAGTSNMVLAGGAEVNNSIHHYRLFASVQALSPTGRCRPFDTAADGIALGEAVACVVLKRLADAQRDGDRIYAVIKGIGSASDGRSRGLTAPRPEGQRRALERAYRMAGISPAEVGLVEAHGTGTVVGDRTELAVLTELFTEAGTPAGHCTLGSVKSQIGHTRATAGLAGLIKAARAVHTGVRPPTGQLREPNPYWNHDTSPFSFDVTARPWTSSARRVAGVSAFGFGGTNFHAVLTSYDGAPEPRCGVDAWPAELFLFTGPDRATAIAKMGRLAELLTANEGAGQPWRLRDLARAVCDSRRDQVWTAIVANDLDDLATKLDRARAAADADGVFVASQRATASQVAFLFPGQGSQRPGMLADLFVAFPRLRHFLELGDRWAEAMFPPAAFSKQESARQRAVLTDTRVAQPALGIAGLAMHELLTSLGVRPDHLGGHSYGELVALAAAGAVDPAGLLELSEARGQAILAAAGADPGTMAAVSAAAGQVRAVLGDGPVVVANHNAPGQSVISGPTPAVEAALHRLTEVGLTGTRIPVACAFHSPVVAGATRIFAAELDRRTVESPRLPVWSNTTAAPYPAEPTAIRATLAAHVAQPVRFVEQVEAMYEAGVRVFIETGPGRVLTALVATILADRPHVAVATDVPGESGLRRLLLALAELAVAGVPVDPAALFHGRDTQPVAAWAAESAALPRRPGWVVNGHLVKTADGHFLAGGLQPAHQVRTPDSGDGRDAAVLEFLRSTRELVAAQREIMLGYLGATPPDPAQLPAAALHVSPVHINPVHINPVRISSGQPVAARPAALVIPAAVQITELRRPEPADLTPEGVLATVRSVVSERTGYPVDMLETDLDLEADLSVDSIKRTELIGLFTDRLGLARTGTPLDESAMDELAQLRTLRGIVDWITNWTGAPAHTTPAQATPAHVTPAPRTPPQRARRYLVDVAALPPLAGPPDAPLVGRRVAIVGDGGGIALELSVLLERRGADVRLLNPDQPTEVTGTDALIYLAALDRGRAAVLPAGFTALRDAVVGGVSQLLVVTGSGGRFGRAHNPNGVAGIGLPGLVRTIAREFPDRLVRVIDVEPKEEPVHIAGYLLAELLTPHALVAVGYAAGERVTLQLAAAPLDPGGPVVPRLGPDSVVLLTGGARGITARVAIGLARAGAGHLELVGRTPQPLGDEDPQTAAATDRLALRRVLAHAGDRGPAEIEATSSRILAEREIRATLAELDGIATYSAVDVRNPAAVRALVAGVYRRHGRLDGIVHGAGVLADRLLVDKTPEVFARVWETKVDGARALAEAARADLGFLVLFGSVSGVFGNRGQVDYSAANDALDTLARIWAPRSHGRVLAVDWGPWAAPDDGTGMVSAELTREYARRGIGLIEPADGVACLLAELAGGTDSQAIYMCADPDAFEVGQDG